MNALSDEDRCSLCGDVRRLHSTHGECRFTARPDAPRSGLFNCWHDAYCEARFRADITRRRYRVWLEPNNRWWNVTETLEHLT
ncbi:hypothetical protein MINTM018_52540 (plasmid) [Mycobacterium intracellulare]|uniref:Uncharacterized protein n=1 Tax=Mycobacterium intracellulare TaxID=1767 RepID=A0A7R7RQC0_MYCIT|nr:hypothetical protein MINTM018_52540 [Mycobacterium intracellulare]